MFESKYYLADVLSAMMTLRVSLIKFPSELRENPEGFLFGLMNLLKYCEEDLRKSMRDIDHEVNTCYVEKTFESPDLEVN